MEVFYGSRATDQASVEQQTTDSTPFTMSGWWPRTCTLNIGLQLIAADPRCANGGCANQKTELIFSVIPSGPPSVNSVIFGEIACNWQICMSHLHFQDVRAASAFLIGVTCLVSLPHFSISTVPLLPWFVHLLIVRVFCGGWHEHLK